MDVEHRLAGLPVAVEDRAVAALVIPVLARQQRGPADQRSDESILGGGEVVGRLDVLSRNEERVQGRLLVDVLDADDLVVFIQDLRRKLAGDDAAEQAIRQGATS